jgi:hypothetical protein
VKQELELALHLPVLELMVLRQLHGQLVVTEQELRLLVQEQQLVLQLAQVLVLQLAQVS